MTLISLALKPFIVMIAIYLYRCFTAAIDTYLPKRISEFLLKKR